MEEERIVREPRCHALKCLNQIDVLRGLISFFLMNGVRIRNNHLTVRNCKMLEQLDLCPEVLIAFVATKEITGKKVNPNS
jgi:hypothetical protein